MPSKRPEYEQTKKLVNIALKSGMTQEQVSKSCRVNQSTVSRWRNGVTRANVDQVKPLLKLFGDRMERPPFQLYQRRAVADHRPSRPQILKVDGRLILRETYISTEKKEAIRFSVQEVRRGHFAVILESASGEMPKKQDKDRSIDHRSRYMPWIVGEGQATIMDIKGLLSSVIHVVDTVKDYPGVERLELLTTLALLKHGYNVEGLETLPMD